MEQVETREFKLVGSAAMISHSLLGESEPATDYGCPHGQGKMERQLEAR